MQWKYQICEASTEGKIERISKLWNMYVEEVFLGAGGTEPHMGTVYG